MCKQPASLAPTQAQLGRKTCLLQIALHKKPCQEKQESASQRASSPMMHILYWTRSQASMCESTILAWS